MANNFPQWEEAHYSQLTQPATDLDRYFNDRDKVVPYVASPQPAKSKVQPVVTLDMKRYFAAGGFTTFCVVVIAAAEQGAFSAAATVGGYIALGGIGIGVAWVVLRACFAWTPTSDSSNGQSKSGGNNYYYQYNNFGENPNQNNG